MINKPAARSAEKEALFNWPKGLLQKKPAARSAEKKALFTKGEPGGGEVNKKTLTVFHQKNDCLLKKNVLLVGYPPSGARWDRLQMFWGGD